MGKKLSAAIFYRLLDRLTDTEIPLDTGDFRLMTRRALDAFLHLPEQARFIRGMVAWVGFRQIPFAYDRAERHAGETHYPLAKMIRLALDAVTGFSTAPLRFASHAGLALTGLSLLLFGYIAISWMFGRTVQGWTSMMLVVVGLGAVQMFVLGMIGEYLGRLYIESKKRPALYRRRCDRAGTPRQPAGSPWRYDRRERDAGRHRHLAHQITFEAENVPERRVDCRWRQRIVAGFLATADA